MDRWVRISLLFSLAALFFFCLSPMTSSAPGRNFNKLNYSHEEHSSELDCTDCHALNKDSKEPEFPEINLCRDCHEDFPSAGIVFPLNRNNLKQKKDSVFIFKHQDHSLEACKDCHIIHKKGLPFIPKQKTCEKCHNENSINPSCKDCHERTRFVPSNHRLRWTSRHGRLSDKGLGQKSHGNDCNSCHEQAACNACHRLQRPKDHTGFFRIRGHGIQAEINRKSCETCHQESYCIRCHRETRPLNHRGLWKYSHGLAIPGGKTGSIRNCGLCHQQTWCVQCHNN